MFSQGKDMYNLLFFGTYILMTKAEKYEEKRAGYYQALSAVLCLVATHFLFFFSCVTLFSPRDFDLSIELMFTFFILLTFLFWFSFVRAGRYEALINKYSAQRGRALSISIIVNFVLAMTFFVMASVKIYEAW